MDFKHENEEVKFELPSNYQTYLHSCTCVIRLIDYLSSVIDYLKNNTDVNEDVLLHFEDYHFVNVENDMEIIAEGGEYFHDENSGFLYLIFLFNINTAFKLSGTNMIGLKVRVNSSDVHNFIESLKALT